MHVVTRTMAAFTAAAASGKHELVVRKDSLPASDAAAIESGEDQSLFAAVTLNHLRLSGFAGLRAVSPLIGRLENLLQLILEHNGLQSLPDEIGSLNKLRLLDLSHNELQSVPPSLYSLPSLQSLFLGHNRLEDSSFPPPPDSGSVLPNLHHVDLVQNQLMKLPDFIFRAVGITELVVSDNLITVLPASVSTLVSLKQLEMKRNKVTELPYELSLCAKLKSLGMEENPLKDKRLLKLVAQHGAKKPKTVLDYVASHAPKPAGKGTAKKGRGGKKKPVPQSVKEEEEEESDSDVEFADVRPIVRIQRPEHYLEVQAHPEARRVRAYLVCAVVRDLDLGRGEALREFITLQTKLHDTLCKRRRVATIATHDLSTVTPPLSYCCAPAKDFALVPLGWSNETTAQGFLDHVEANRPERVGGGRRAKPQDPAAAVLTKYLSYVNASEMVYLQDSAGTVISLPPLTNCETTKISASSCNVLLEVTSGHSLASCKAVMDALIEGMCEGGVVSSDGVLHVEQVKVMGEGGGLLVLYPSRTDLTSDKIEVKRP